MIRLSASDDRLRANDFNGLSIPPEREYRKRNTENRISENVAARLGVVGKLNFPEIAEKIVAGPESGMAALTFRPH
jgi:hypothetical protein